MDTGLKPSHSQIADFLTDNIISEITRYLMEDFGCSLEDAFDTIYSSHVLELLQNEDGELYVQSPSYIYEMLSKEKGLQTVNETGIPDGSDYLVINYLNARQLHNKPDEKP